MLPRLSLVLGGAASGESAFAELLVKAHADAFTYLATAQAFDAEMKAKIEVHKARRGPEWTIIETPVKAAQNLGKIEPGTVVLFDCATMWLSNQLLAEADLDTEQIALMSALDSCRAPVVIVSNEVGNGIVPENALARRFRDAQGRLNIALAARAELVVQVIAGLPRVLKGELP